MKNSSIVRDADKQQQVARRYDDRAAAVPLARCSQPNMYYVFLVV